MSTAFKGCESRQGCQPTDPDRQGNVARETERPGTAHPPAVREYIATQDERPRKVSFRDEYEALLRKHGAVYDADHLWDS